MTQNTGQKIIDRQFHLLAEGLKNSEPLIFMGSGIDVGHLICFFKAQSAEEIFAWAARCLHGCENRRAYEGVYQRLRRKP